MESSKTVGITEVVLRDGIQSLLATRVPLRGLVLSLQEVFHIYQELGLETHWINFHIFCCS